MGKLVCLENERSKRMTPARIVSATVVSGRVVVALPVGDRKHKLIRLTPAQAETLGQTLLTLAESARQEGREST